MTICKTNFCFFVTNYLTFTIGHEIIMNDDLVWKNGIPIFCNPACSEPLHPYILTFRKFDPYGLGLAVS